jgi:AcrR family transcriptional regulator
VMAAPRTRDPDRAQKILDAAARLFYERGFHAVSVDEIGEAAGATGAAIYRHFSGKEDLLSTLFDEAQDRYLLAVPSPMDDPFAELQTLVDRTLVLTIEQRELAAIWSREDRALSGPYLRRVLRRARQYVDRWVDCLARCYPEHDEADLRIAARAAIGTMNSLAARPGPQAFDDHELEIVSAMILAGLGSLAAAPSVPQL